MPRSTGTCPLLDNKHASVLDQEKKNLPHPTSNSTKDVLVGHGTQDLLIFWLLCTL